MPPQRLHHAKFRWTENLTCRFIQLRKENGKLFTGRKYSAQAGWELILRQMREEFPTIMAHVHYRVLKKKWSNLLQQYKELRNPVHGDRNKADDVSWPFFGAIDQVLEDSNRQAALLSDDYIDPQEFLCVSVTPEVPGLSSEGRPAESNAEVRSKGSTILTLRRLQSPDDDGSIEIDEHGAPSRTGRLTSGLVPPGKRYTHGDLVPRIPRATGLSIERIPPVSGERRAEADLRHWFHRDDNSGEGTGSGGSSLRRRETIVDPPRSASIAPTWTPGDGGGGGVEPAGLENRRVHQVVGGQLAETGNCQSRRTISEARQVSGGNWSLRETLNEARQSGAGDGRALENGADDEEAADSFGGPAKWQRRKPKKPGRVRRATRGSCPGGEDDRELRIYQRLEQLLEYARRRDEENRSIMMRILQAVEAIAKKL